MTSEQMTNVDIHQYTKGYVQRLVTKAGLSNLPDDEKEKHLERLHEELLKRIGVVVLQNLNEQDRKTYLEEHSNAEQAQHAEQFLEERLPNLEDIIRQGVQDFSKEYLLAVAK